MTAPCKKLRTSCYAMTLSQLQALIHKPLYCTPHLLLDMAEMSSARHLCFKCWHVASGCSHQVSCSAHGICSGQRWLPFGLQPDFGSNLAARQKGQQGVQLGQYDRQVALQAAVAGQNAVCHGFKSICGRDVLQCREYP